MVTSVFGGSYTHMKDWIWKPLDNPSSPASPPLEIGITGKIKTGDTPEARRQQAQTVKARLRKLFAWILSSQKQSFSLPELYPRDPSGMVLSLEGFNRSPRQIRLLSSLAPGVDQWAVEVAGEFDIPHLCPLPFPADLYAKASTFNPDWATPEERTSWTSNFQRLLANAEAQFPVCLQQDSKDPTALAAQLNRELEGRGTRRRRYRAAGEYIAACSHLLVVVGDPPDPDSVSRQALLHHAETCGSDLIAEIKHSGQYSPRLLVEATETNLNPGPVILMPLAETETTHLLPPRRKPPRSLQLPGGVEMRFIHLPTPGTFWMGDREGDSDEQPLNQVTVDPGPGRDLWMAETPVTRGQWASLMDAKNAEWETETDHHPQHTISWYEAAEFCNRLSRHLSLDGLFGTDPGQVMAEENLRQWKIGDLRRSGLRMPTEAEWEYACRAGSESSYAGGDLEQHLDGMGWYAKNAKGKTQVAGKAANDWGLYDMHGNVWEWCMDWWNADRYRSVEGENPMQKVVVDKEEPWRLWRGGGWVNSARWCRSAVRYGYWPRVADDDLGFRPVWVLRSPVDTDRQSEARSRPGDERSEEQGGGASGAHPLDLSREDISRA